MRLRVTISLFLLCAFSTNLNAHSSWIAHADDMMAVLGFEESSEIRNWMKFISSDMIDQPGSFYDELKTRHPGFTCKHRALFHWGYNAVPWNYEIERKVKIYCEQYNLNYDSNIRVFKSELIAEQKRRNRLINLKTESLFGFAHGGKDAQYAVFFASMAYNIHLVGDHMSDNTDFDGVQKLENVIGLIVISLKNFNLNGSKNVIKNITAINRKYQSSTLKADALMKLLKQEVPDVIKKAQDGSIKRRIENKGFRFRY